MSEDLTQLILAEAVTALYNRFMTPYGQKQRLTAEQLHVIDEAHARAGVIMSDDRGVFIPRDGISRRRGIELATEMIKRAAAEWHSGRGDRGCHDNAALVAAYERGVAEGRRQAGVLESIVREAACVTGETITDWQRGYGACSARVLAAIDSWASAPPSP